MCRSSFTSWVFGFFFKTALTGGLHCCGTAQKCNCISLQKGGKKLTETLAWSVLRFLSMGGAKNRFSCSLTKPVTTILFWFFHKGQCFQRVLSCQRPDSHLAAPFWLRLSCVTVKVNISLFSFQCARSPLTKWRSLATPASLCPLKCTSKIR